MWKYSNVSKIKDGSSSNDARTMEIYRLQKTKKPCYLSLTSKENLAQNGSELNVIKVSEKRKQEKFCGIYSKATSS